MSSLTYPSSLPCPKSSTVTPVERRALSNAARPREARALARDRLEVEKIEFPPMTPIEFATFRVWWESDLVLGGAWFAADWPLPRGIITAVRKFIGAPVWSYLPGGFWRITATCQVRGRGETPAAPLAFVDCELLLHFDEATRSSWIDYSTKHHPIVLLDKPDHPVEAGPGVFAGGLKLTQIQPGSAAEDFYNTQTKIAVQGAIELGNGEFFMTARVKIASVSGNGYSILTNIEAGGGNLHGFQFKITPALGIGFSYNGGAVLQAGTVPTNQWTEIAVSRVPHSPHDLLWFFLDGVALGSAEVTVGADVTTRNVSYIGAYNGSTDPLVAHFVEGFEGGIDELFVIKGPGTGRSTSYTLPTEPFGS